MTIARALWYYLWIAPHVLLLVILVVMLLRRLHRQFPIFFLYTLFEICQFAFLFFSMFHYRYRRMFGGEYEWFYSVGLGLSTTLRFGVIYETLVHLLRNYPALQKSGRSWFRAVAVAFLLVAVVVAAASSGNAASGVLIATAQILDQTVSILQCGLLIFLFSFSRYFSLSWRSQAFGIALGLGVFASMELATSALRSHVGSSGNHFLNYWSMGTYHLCVLIWLFYLIASEGPPNYNSRQFPQHDLEDWNLQLQKMVKK